MNLKWKLVGMVVGFGVILLSTIIIKKNNQARSFGNLKKAEFTSAGSCIECHTDEYNLWKESHHAHAMEIATDSSVRGDFNNAVLTEGENAHRFFKKEGKFMVYTRGEEGKWGEYEITHTFGYEPLQQYLVPFDNGKYQCLPLAWDTEKNQWFDLSKGIHGEQPASHDWLYWTNQGQNWNGMCAECHSTNLNKNYYVEADSFHTTYSEINVSCEACHGPGSMHIKWGRLPEDKRPSDVNTGLVVKTNNLDNEDYVNMCARCHSRRSQFSDFEHDYQDIYDYMNPVLINEHYFADGQILDENYVYGSFKQSRMHTKMGVKCNDCHDVHSGESYYNDNRLCYKCHAEPVYGSPEHHFHKTADQTKEEYIIDGRVAEPGEGASCVNCHMPGRYYMVNDFRNDHSLRIPRPDLTKKINTPNACNQCHTDKSVDWAIKYTEQWYGKNTDEHYGLTLHKARNQLPGAEQALITLAHDTQKPLIIRATALEYLGAYSSEQKQQVIRTYLSDEHPMMRVAAINAYIADNRRDYLNDLIPRLTDSVAAVRQQAAFKLSYLSRDNIPSVHKTNYDSAI
ncbi:MAG: hypothetical protein GVY19_13340 [Bacteroidetes bacterium]|jgi:Zn finger protein HypA/HybF involved in hydrogenase expression|nr:hypothetical protein [Bacteroidota bacterium]